MLRPFLQVLWSLPLPASFPSTERPFTPSKWVHLHCRLGGLQAKLVPAASLRFPHVAANSRGLFVQVAGASWRMDWVGISCNDPFLRRIEQLKNCRTSHLERLWEALAPQMVQCLARSYPSGWPWKAFIFGDFRNGHWHSILLMEEILHQLIWESTIIDRVLCIPSGAGFLLPTVPPSNCHWRIMKRSLGPPSILKPAASFIVPRWHQTTSFDGGELTTLVKCSIAMLVYWVPRCKPCDVSTEVDRWPTRKWRSVLQKCNQECCFARRRLDLKIAIGSVWASQSGPKNQL